MHPEVRSYNLWILVRRMDEHPEFWRADIPGLDYFAQGRTPTAAIEAAREASETLILNDLNTGREPKLLDFGEGHKEISDVLLRGHPIRADELDTRAEEIDAVAVSFRVDCVKRSISLPVTYVETPREQSAA